MKDKKKISYLLIIFMLHIFLLTGCKKNDNEIITIDLGENKSDSETITVDLGEEKSDVSTNVVEESVTELISEYDTYSGTWTSNGYDEISAEIDTDEDIDINYLEQEIINRDSYRTASKYWNDVVEWDEDNGRYGLDRPLEPILCSDQREYTIEELKDYPEEILYLALNEIYARHGYIFKDEDLQNYFMGQVWYTPLVEGENFSDEVFNDYEKENLQLLLKISNR
jgi:hypothetical protein